MACICHDPARSQSERLGLTDREGSDRDQGPHPRQSSASNPAAGSNFDFSHTHTQTHKHTNTHTHTPHGTLPATQQKTHPDPLVRRPDTLSSRGRETVGGRRGQRHARTRVRRGDVVFVFFLHVSHPGPTGSRASSTTLMTPASLPWLSLPSPGRRKKRGTGLAGGQREGAAHRGGNRTKTKCCRWSRRLVTTQTRRSTSNQEASPSGRIVVPSTHLKCRASSHLRAEAKCPGSFSQSSQRLLFFFFFLPLGSSLFIFDYFGFLLLTQHTFIYWYFFPEIETALGR